MSSPDALSAAASPVPPVARFAGQIVSFASPLMRIRYPAGVYVDIRGFPTWIRYARAVVEFGVPDPRLAADELRVTRVVAANQLMAGSTDPLWHPAADPASTDGADGPDEVTPTPDGWMWVHFARSRRVGLLPAELATAFRHWGGIATSGVTPGGGLPLGRSRSTVEFTGIGPAAEEELAKLEQELGRPLPAAYREFLAATNGGRPTVPAVHPKHGFVLDQSLFQVGGKDWFHNVAYLRRWLSDRFTGDFLAIGRVQGGMLALKLTEPSAGSVWFWDADDVRDHDRYDAKVVTRDLLHRCGNGFDTFLRALMPVRDPLLGAARDAADTAYQVVDPRIGTALPVKHRPPEGLTPVRGQRGRAQPDSDTWESVRDRLRPLLRPATFGFADHLEHGTWSLSRTILPCLREFVVIDQPQTMTYVNEDAPERWGVDPELIFATARANLAATAPAPDADPDDGPAILRFVGVEYAEALPLLDGWLASYAGQLGGTPVAFMPGDGTLLLVSGTEEQIGDMLSFIESEYAEAEKPLSPMAYTVDDAGVLIPYPFRWGNPGSAAVMRAAVRLATTEYAYQKEVLDEHHDGETIDIFVPTVMLSERTDGALLTVSTWGEGVDTLLPQTDLVAFASDHEESFMVSWAVLAERVVLVPEPGLDPPRYRVRGWPPPDVVAELRRLAE